MQVEDFSLTFLLWLCYNSLALTKLENGMKIDSVITMEVKTREEELEELLSPDGELNAAVYKAVRGIVEAERDRGEDASDAEYGALDNAINEYMKYAIEYDRLKRRS